MINLIKTPQRADIKAEYKVDNDILTIEINGVSEVFDFTGPEEGVAEEIIVELLPINPIISVEKIGDTVNIQAIYFYGEGEKEVFENGKN